MPPNPKLPAATPAASQQRYSSSSSKESTPSLESLAGGVATAASSQATSSNNDSIQGTRTLVESFAMALRYGSEYMDENPLVGEPGAFILSTSRAAGPNPALASTSAPTKINGGTTTTKPVVGEQKPVSPSPFGADANPDTINTITTTITAKKSEKSGEKSPTSPVGAPGKAKRRKSKAAPLSAGLITPF